MPPQPTTLQPIPQVSTSPAAPSSSQSSGISPIAVNAAKAIRQIESGGNYQATSKDGSFGAYQYIEPTWNAASQKYLGKTIPWQQATREEQNEVAVKQINDWITSGKAKNIGQVASMWNAGEGAPDAYLNGKSGTNSSGVKYDVGAYAKKVATEYQKIRGGTDTSTANETQITPSISQQEDTSLGGALKNRVQDASNAVGSIVGGEKTGNSRLSGLLQLGGSIAGGIGDVVNKGLELIPGVKQLEGLAGQAVGSLAKTSVGQSVTKAVQDFSTAHPELSKDIGAGFNIVTAIPILKGIGVAGSVAKDALASSLKGVAEKSVQNGLEETVGKAGLRGAKFLDTNPTIAKDMVEARALPEIKGGKYDSLPEIKNSQDRIKQFSEDVSKSLDNSTYSTKSEGPASILKNAVAKTPLSDFTSKDILENARNLTPQNNRLWTKFEAGQATMKDINKLRSDLDSAVKSVYTTTNEPPIKKELGANLAGAMREYVQSNAPETQETFANMVKEYRIQKALGYLHNKSIKTGVVGRILKDVGTAGGEAIGNASGIPLAGGFIGRETGGAISKRVARISAGVLKKTGKNAIRTSLKTATKKIGIGAIGALTQKSLDS